MNWDQKHTKTLLRLPKHPIRWLEESSYQAWLDARGGVAVVRRLLLERADLSAEQRTLLQTIYRHPYTASDVIARELYIGRTHYFSQIKSLIPRLTTTLNQWQRETAPTIVLPHPPTALIGTDNLIAQIRHTFEQPNTRLVTLIGPGGIGKTRLSIAIAHAIADQFPDGVHFVDLVPINQPQLLAHTLCQTLGIDTIDVLSAEQAVQTQLKADRRLIVLDNFEHVIAAAPMLQSWLYKLPHVKFIVTSREALRIYGEHVVPVTGLSAEPAVQLFLARAQAVNPSISADANTLALIAQLCEQVNGMPLAIELLAAQTRYLTVAHLSQQLREQGAILRLQAHHDTHTRQETLWNALDWSYRLLEPTVQGYFRQLAIFTGSWDAAAAQAITQIEQATLFQLLDKNLVERVNSAEAPRYRLLEIMREFGLQQMESADELATLQARHTHFYLQRVLTARRSGRSAELQQLANDAGNWRSALQQLLDQNAQEQAVQLCEALIHYWFMRGVESEARWWVTQTIEHCSDVRTPEMVSLLRQTTGLMRRRDEQAQVRTYTKVALQIAHGLEQPDSLAMALSGVAQTAIIAGEYEQAEVAVKHLQDMVRIAESPIGLAWSSLNVAELATAQGKHTVAITTLVEMLPIFEAHQAVLGLVIAKNHLGRAYISAEQWQSAEQTLLSSLNDVQQVGDSRWGIWLHGTLGRCYLKMGLFDQADTHFRTGIAIAVETGAERDIVLNLEGLAHLAFQANQLERAVRLIASADRIRQQIVALAPTAYPEEYQEQQHLLAQLRASYPAFDQAWQHGSELSWQDTCHHALKVAVGEFTL